jgi:endoglucanase
VKELIKDLTEIWGPSGREDKVREFIQAEIQGLVDDMRVDVMGNLIAHKVGTVAGTPRIMLAAHMDEIGFIVSYIDEKGFLRFNNIGGIRSHTLIGERVVFADGLVGVFGVEKVDKPADVLKMDKIFIDVGAVDKADAESKVQVGDMGAYQRPFVDLGQRLMANNFDDRIGCAILVQILKELSACPNEVYFVFTVQEEVGLRGARTSAFGIDPDIGIAVDITVAGDTPESRVMPMELGKGAAIKVKDRSLLVSPKVRELLVETARAHDIPYQLEVLPWGGTDAGAIQVTRAGVLAGCVSVVTRHAHTPSEMVDYGDVRACVDLLMKLLESPITL